FGAELRNWPVQLQLLNPNAPYLKNADLLIAADCAPFAYANFHQRFLKDKVLIILCPKLDKTIDQYVAKLAEIFQKQNIKSISIVHMEVPCCSGIETIVKKALEKAEKNIIIKDYTISINGEII
ncbi:MAG: 4Fe-4S ferredoxin, partial [Methanobacterium paludis]|nr:4Fe-4S ferredoxin [Methanobacterium paludis]